MENFSKKFSYSLSVLIALVAISLSACSKDDNGGETPEPPPVVVQQGTASLSLTMPSTAMNQTMKYSIYLPYGYSNSTENYPVLYLLHGMYGNETDWLNQGATASTTNSLISRNEIPKMIIVMPNGFNAFYVNGYQNNYQYETYFINELIPYIESHYRAMTTRNGRAIAGLSMGGYGATYHAFKRPEMFVAAASMSGAVEGMNSSLVPAPRNVIASYTPSQISALPKYFMDCGTEDALVFSSNETFAAYLNTKGVDFTYRKRTGTHDWIFWTTSLPDVLKFIGPKFNK